MSGISRSLVCRSSVVALVLSVAVVYFIIPRPVANAQIGSAQCVPNGPPSACPAKCPGSYGCMPAQAGYNWGVCYSGEVTCTQVLSMCTAYTCTTPPSKLGTNPCNVGPYSFSACK
jgi:hypothetical protein